MDDQVATRVLPATLASPGYATRIGLCVLSTDEIGQRAFERVLPEGKASVVTTRVNYSDEDGFTVVGGFKTLLDALPPPGRIDVIAFSCTSGTVAMGKDQLLDAMAKGRPGLKYTSPAVAALAAFEALEVHRIALLTPYPVAMHRQVRQFFSNEGIEIVADATFNLSTDAEIGELSKASLFSAAKELVAEPVDALFVSCTATPLVPFIDELEKELGVTVITSTQAMAWHAMRLGGAKEPVQGFGRLLRDC